MVALVFTEKSMQSEDDDGIFHFDGEFPQNKRISITSTNSLKTNLENVDPKSDYIVELHDFALKSPNSKTNKIQLNDFDVKSVIGKGAYGQVFLVKKKNTEQLYAMKVLRKASIVLHGKDSEHTRNERSVLEEINHPFIVKLHYAFQCPSRLYLILSYASGGELFGYLAKERMFSEDQAQFYIGEILLGLEHLHGLGIIYRDLKPENVMLGADGHILLTDFGLSKVALDTHTVCGTIEYRKLIRFMAPEIVEARHRYDKTVDFWSLGIMLYDMVCGQPPFVGNNHKKVCDAILKTKPKFPAFMTARTKDLCTKLLKKHPGVRLGALGAKQVKDHLFFKGIDFKKLALKQIKPHHIPVLKSENDTSHFGVEFTKVSIKDTFLSDSQQLVTEGMSFVGFSFVADGHL